MRYSIPFNRASLAGPEPQYLLQAMAQGHLSGDGPFTARCHELLQDVLGVRRVFLTTSCTHALEMAAMLLSVGPGDEVIVPSFTFVSTANAFAIRGARVVFADIRADTLNIDERLLDRLISERTKAIVPVHYSGVGCAMEVIAETATRRGIAVVEDNAHGLFGKYHGRWLGTFGALAALSFHETKNFTCGEGGALLVNEEGLTERAEILREKGTDRSRFFRGEVDKYSWVDIGSSYLPSELLAAFLCAQLEARDAILEQRRRVWEHYRAHLADWAAQNCVRLPVVPPDCEHSYSMFYLVMPSLEARSALIGRLRARGILAVSHYVPLHLSPMGRRHGGREGDCPVTEAISDRLVRLPMYNSLNDADLETVVAAIRDAPIHPGFRPDSREP